MRKVLGNFGGAIAAKFLRTVPLLLLISAPFCHAEACDATSIQTGSITSIAPSPWNVGQTFNVLVTGVFQGSSGAPGCQYTEVSVQTPEGMSSSYLPPGSGGNTTIQAVVGGVTISNIVWVSASQTSFTISIDAGTPAEMAELFLSCDGCNNGGVGAPIQIVKCPIPTISAVSPSTWFAGKTYNNVKITGTGFVTTEKATPTCPVTTVTIAAADTSQVTVSNVSVVDKTKITLTVAPPASDPTQAATITAGTAPPNQATFNTAQVLGNIIKCSASMPVCGGTTISAPHDPPPIVVGQQIALVANPDLPSSITPLNTTWTVGGTRIAGYNPTTGRTSVKELADADLKKTSITFYWPYTETAVPVTYNYCVDIDGAEPKHQCSQDATATFEVDGPTGGTMSFTPFAPAITIANLTACTDSSGKAWPGGPYMVYATGETGPSCPGKATLTAFGITFNSPTGYSDPSGGAFSLVQLISSDVTTGEGGTTHGPGLDFSYPYSSIFPSSDSPKLHLPASATDKTRTFTANMFLMWQSSTDHSIPVPLGYQTWGFSGTASCSKNCGKAANWTVANTEGTTPGPAASGFVPSAPSQTSIAGTNNILVDGYPTWTGLSQ